MQLEDILKLNLKKKIIISLVVFILIIACLIYFIVIPTIKDIKRMGVEIEIQRIDLEEKYQKGQSLRQLTETLEEIEPQLSKLNQVFINQNRELEFITTLEEVADYSNIMQKINLSDFQGIDNQKYKKMPFQLFAQGSFINQMNYLTYLEALNYYININFLELSPGSAQLASSGETSAQGSINMLIIADTYWR